MKPFAPTGSFPRLTQLLMVLIGGQIPALTYSLLSLLRRAGDVVRRLACEQTITDVFAANNGIAPCTSGCPFVGVYPPPYHAAAVKICSERGAWCVSAFLFSGEHHGKSVI